MQNKKMQSITSQSPLFESLCPLLSKESCTASLQLKNKENPASKRICSSMIYFFQHYISPIDGPRSSYYPTSSQYALDAILKYGVLKGIALGCDRLLRENKELWVYEITKEHGMERKLDPVR